MKRRRVLAEVPAACYPVVMQLANAPGQWIRDNLLTLLFYLYAIFAAPWLAPILKSALAGGEPQLVAGTIVFAVLLFESLGIHWKILFLRRRALEAGREPEGSMLGWFSTAVIGHIMVTAFVVMLALDCCGFPGGAEMTPWVGGILIGFIAKDFLVLFTSGGKSVSREPPGHPKEWIADVLMTLFACVAYTAWWESLLDLNELGEAGVSLAMRFVLAPFLGLIYLLVYLPLRLPFLLEEYYLNGVEGRKRRILTELAIGLALGLYPLFV